MDIKVKRWGKGGRSVDIWASRKERSLLSVNWFLYQGGDQSDKQGEDRTVHAVQLNVRE
jgi:hypothetical protein